MILATGYKRDHGDGLLDAVRGYIHETKLERDYRLPAPPEFRPAIFLQGYSESTHGLSDTLLSVLAIRAQEIASSLLGIGGLNWMGVAARRPSICTGIRRRA